MNLTPVELGSHTLGDATDDLNFVKVNTMSGNVHDWPTEAHALREGEDRRRTCTPSIAGGPDPGRVTPEGQRPDRYRVSGAKRGGPPHDHQEDAARRLPPRHTPSSTCAEPGEAFLPRNISLIAVEPYGPELLEDDGHHTRHHISSTIRGSTFNVHVHGPNIRGLHLPRARHPRGGHLPVL